MLSLKDIDNFTLEQIYEEANESLRNQMLRMRACYLSQLATDRVARKVIHKNSTASILTILAYLDEEYQRNTSEFYFPGDICCFYPKVVESRAINFRTCDISGAVIPPGGIYLSYRPLIDNLTKGKTFVLKRTIHTELGYSDFFPDTLYRFEYLAMCLQNPYEMIDSNYNYYELSKTLGENLSLLELPKKKVRK